MTHQEGPPKGTDHGCPAQAGALQDTLTLGWGLLLIALEFLHPRMGGGVGTDHPAPISLKDARGGSSFAIA